MHGKYKKKMNYKKNKDLVEDTIENLIGKKKKKRL